jgi:DNA-binding Xre family transcriptional regulator
MEDLREHGPQPLDDLMEKWAITNHQLVETSTEQLSHKQVQKARKGRQLTLTMMQKVCRALNITIWNRLTAAQKEIYFEYMHRHLFNYAKGHEPDWVDPNVDLFPKKG